MTVGASEVQMVHEKAEKAKLTAGLGKHTFFLEVALTILGALVVSLLLRLFVVQIVPVSGASMDTTLHSSQRVVASMFSYALNDPCRGDIVLCEYPNSSDTYIKRVVGMPGEMVMIRDGVVYINGRALHEEYIELVADRDFGPSIVPAASYFVLGDNRPISGDSRLEAVGPIPENNIRGKVLGILSPFSEMGAIK